MARIRDTRHKGRIAGGLDVEKATVDDCKQALEKLVYGFKSELRLTKVGDPLVIDRKNDGSVYVAFHIPRAKEIEAMRCRNWSFQLGLLAAQVRPDTIDIMHEGNAVYFKSAHILAKAINNYAVRIGKTDLLQDISAAR